MGNFCFVSFKSQSPTIITKSSLGNSSETDTEITSKLSSINETGSINDQIAEVPNLRTYTFSELGMATGNFKLDPIIGGGFSLVYKGWVDRSTLNPTGISGQGIAVAVEKLNHENIGGLEELQAQVNFVGRLSHPNLVKLLGYCIDDRNLFLVYEYMAKGSLENHLFRRATGPEPLSWNTRLTILIGAAQGLAFLHYAKHQVTYRDFKPSNILLDSDYNAKLSDFGITKNKPTGEDRPVAPQIVQTYGYAAPEYIATGYLSMKSDVYGFGVVLLEMLSGLRTIDRNRPKQKWNLVNWAKPYLLHRRTLINFVMDKSLKGQYNPKAALQVAQLTMRCLATNPKERPYMEEVGNILQKVEAIELNSSMGSKSSYSKTVKNVT